MQSRYLTEPMRCSPPSPTTCAALDAAETRGGGNVTETPRGATFLSPESRWRRRGPKGRIELAGLPGLHLARRGFWGATISRQSAAAAGSVLRCKLPPAAADWFEAVVVWERTMARPRIAVWRRLGLTTRADASSTATELRTTLLRTIPVWQRKIFAACEDKSIAGRIWTKIRKIRPRSSSAPHRRRAR